MLLYDSVQIIYHDTDFTCPQINDQNRCVEVHNTFLEALGYLALDVLLPLSSSCALGKRIYDYNPVV